MCACGLPAFLFKVPRFRESTRPYKYTEKIARSESELVSRDPGRAFLSGAMVFFDVARSASAERRVFPGAGCNLIFAVFVMMWGVDG